MSFTPPVGSASSSAKGIIKLAGDLAGTADLPTVANDTITEPKLSVNNSPASNQVLTWSGSAMSWTTPTSSPSPGEVLVESFSGATYSDKFRTALATVGAESPKRALILTPGSTIDAGATPFMIPAGVSIVGGAGVQTEFGDNCPIYARCTGGTAVFTVSPKGTNLNGTKGWSMRHIAFEGTGSQNLFQDQPLDASGTYWAYCTLDNVCADQFNKIYQGPTIGVTIKGTTYYNNMATTAFYIGGSDNTLWSDGAFFEMGTVSSYATRAALPAMVRFGTLSKTYVGPMYSTGSPTTPFRLDGGEGGVYFDGLTIEGRPVPGSGPNFLWCAGELVNLSGGAAILRNKWYGFAMKDPSSTGRTSQGYIQISGGNHLIDGGCVQVYSDQAASPPPFIRITGGTVVVRNITRASNTTQKPVVLTTNAGFVDADSTVTVTVG